MTVRRHQAVAVAEDRLAGLNPQWTSRFAMHLQINNAAADFRISALLRDVIVTW